MNFNSKSEFVYWFEAQIKKQIIPTSNGYFPPSACETVAKLICKRLSGTIVVPSPYVDGGWRGLSNYATKIWDKNYLSILGCEKSSTTSANHSSQNSRQTNYYHSKDSQDNACESIKFSNQTDFVYWFEAQIKKQIIPTSNGYFPPSACETVAKLICKRLSGTIVVPSPYVDGRWRGLSNYATKIWDKNYLSILGCEKSSTTSANHSSQNSRQTNYSCNNTNYNYSQTSQANSSITKDKSGVVRGYDMLLSSLTDAISSFKRMEIKNPDLIRTKTNIISKLNESLRKITNEKNYALECMSWDKLVIGFFGETNAGKSTIIESLRILLNDPDRSSKLRHNIKTDGEIVGDGRQDFTQDYHEYTLEIDNQNFSLIDVPGIEGNENLYKGKIGKALRKAHIIFYVNGHNKDVDRGTANKIQQYMSDGVKVFVLQNVRGNADSYEYPEDRHFLISDGVRTVMNGLNQKFKSLLNDKFGKIIPVQGLLAMCAYADFSPNRIDLSRKQSRLISYFGEDCQNNNTKTRENIKRFSNIDSVINLIKERSKNFKGEIADANFAKLGQFCAQSLKEFISIVESDRSIFLSYKNRVEQFKRRNLELTQTHSSQFEREAQQATKTLINKFSENAIKLIELSDFNHVDIEFKSTNRHIEESIKSLGESYSSRLASSINANARELNNIPGFSSLGNTFLSDFSININFNVDLIKNEDDIKFEDVFKTVGNGVGGAVTGATVGAALGSFIPFIGTAIGAWIGGAIGGGGGIVGGSVSAGEDQTRRAKKKALDMVSSIRSRCDECIKDKAEKFKQDADIHIRNINSHADNRIKEINQFYSCAGVVESNLKKTLNTVNNYDKRR